jgi:hypothetical protein
MSIAGYQKFRRADPVSNSTVPKHNIHQIAFMQAQKKASHYGVQKETQKAMQ